MICIKCGSKIDSSYCHNCGFDVTRKEAFVSLCYDAVSGLESIVDRSKNAAIEPLVNVLNNVSKTQSAKLVNALGKASETPSSPRLKDDELYDVVLNSFGQDKFKAMRIIRELTGLGLKEANDIINSLPAVVCKNIKREKAQGIIRQLEAIGAIVKLYNSSTTQSNIKNDITLEPRTIKVSVRDSVSDPAKYKNSTENNAFNVDGPRSAQTSVDDISDLEVFYDLFGHPNFTNGATDVQNQDDNLPENSTVKYAPNLTGDSRLNVDDLRNKPMYRIGRNDPCPCGSGKKYKNCCGRSSTATQNMSPVPFVMPIEDVFTITGRGTIVLGKVQYGRLNSGDAVDVILADGRRIKTIVTRIEMFKKIIDYTLAGDSVGLVLRGINKDDIKGAQAIVNQNADAVHSSFTANIHIAERADGGKGIPVFDHYSPLYKFPTTTVSGIQDFDLSYGGSRQFNMEDKSLPMLMPGSMGRVSITLERPAVIIPDMEFQITEGPNVLVGTGRVIKIGK